MNRISLEERGRDLSSDSRYSRDSYLLWQIDSSVGSTHFQATTVNYLSRRKNGSSIVTGATFHDNLGNCRNRVTYLRSKGYQSRDPSGYANTCSFHVLAILAMLLHSANESVDRSEAIQKYDPHDGARMEQRGV